MDLIMKNTDYLSRAIIALKIAAQCRWPHCLLLVKTKKLYYCHVFSHSNRFRIISHFQRLNIMWNKIQLTFIKLLLRYHHTWVGPI